MKFEEALNLLRQGKRVRIGSWYKPLFMVFENLQFRMREEFNSGYHKPSLRTEEILSEDWELYEEITQAIPEKKFNYYVFFKYNTKHDSIYASMTLDCNYIVKDHDGLRAIEKEIVSHIEKEKKEKVHQIFITGIHLIPDTGENNDA